MNEITTSHFSNAPRNDKATCHCEDERSEDVAIAKSLNINEITTQSPIARNDKSYLRKLLSALVS